MIEGKRRRDRRCKHILEDLQGKKKILEIERGSTRSHALGTRFGRGYRPVARQAADWMNVKPWSSKLLIQIFGGFRPVCMDFLNISCHVQFI